MKRFKNILAVTAHTVGSDEVLERAADLAEANGALLTVMDIDNDIYVSDTILEERQRKLDRMVQGWRADGLDIRTQARRGRMFLEVTQQVLRNRHDLVITAAEAPGGFRELLFGSNTMHLMRKCPCPVWVLKPGVKKRFERIVAAVDVHPFDEEENAVSHKILQLATSLAAKEGAELHVVHAWDVTGNDAYTLQSEVPDATRKDIVVRHLNRAESRLENLLTPYMERFDGIQTHLKRGEAWQAVSAVERAHKADLIIMGTITRGNVPAFLSARPPRRCCARWTARC
jgi:universal stress protein E